MLSALVAASEPSPEAEPRTENAGAKKMGKPGGKTGKTLEELWKKL
jgi:hypothetical protein